MVEKTGLRVALADLTAALGLLTRLPVRVDTAAAVRRAAVAAWAWPVAGIAVALPAVIMASLSLSLGLPEGASALVLIAVQMAMTGAMHEDGLADSLDGLWGGWDKTRRLAIMKDSHIGTYGVLVLVLSTLLRWQAWTLLLGAHVGAAAIAVAVLSRWPMVLLAYGLTPARTQGLGQSAGRATRQAVALSTLIAVSIAVFCLGAAGIALLPVVLAIALLWAFIARHKIGGQTGDILGAVQVITEVAALLALVVLLN